MSNALDEEILETLTYERSKTWSNFLKQCNQSDDGQLITINDLEKFYENEEEESIAMTMEEAEEDDVPDDIENTSKCMTKAELTLMLCSGDNKEILDQTMPIVEEHMRKWKEAGLDRILNTFDAQKIEHHVGSWLRRHNSAYGVKEVEEEGGVPLKTPCRHDSEAESMHSVDTARYIRASRKRTVSSATKCSNTSSPMTTIKMYRMLPRKRDELRAKYGFNEEQEHHHHMQALLNRRDQLHRRQREYEMIYHTSPRHYPYSVAGSFKGQKRRKQLRKRHDSSPVYPTSSSEDERSSTRCECSPCVRRAISETAAYPYYTYRSYHSHSHSHSHSSHSHSRSHSYRDCHHQRLKLSSRSVHSMHNFKHSVRQLRRQHFEEDLRPRLMENECTCCNNDTLCSNVVHIANSSTEEWLVENRSSPDPLHLETPKKTLKPLKPKLHVPTQMCSLLEAEETLIEQQPKLPKKLISEAETHKTKALVAFFNGETKEPKAQPSVLKAIPYLYSDVKEELPEKPILNEITLPEKSEESIKPASEVRRPDIPKAPTQKKVANNGTVEKRGSKSEKVKSREPKLHEEKKVNVSYDSDGSQRKPVTRSTKKVIEVEKRCNKTDKLKRTEANVNEQLKANESYDSAEFQKPAAKTAKNVIAVAKRGNKAESVKKPELNEENTDESYDLDDSPKKPAAKTAKKLIAAQKISDKSEKLKKTKAKPSEEESAEEFDDSDDDFEKALQLSKITYSMEQQKLQQQQQQQQKKTMAAAEKTQFNNNSVACNSTALSNDTASVRVLKAKKKCLPRKQAIPANSPKTIIDLSSSASTCKSLEDGEADCTVVTSTTGCGEATVSVPEKTIVAPRLAQLKLTKKGILLYAPSRSGPDQTDPSFSSSNIKEKTTYTLTEHSLSPIIGERKARKFFKYYMGNSTFDGRYSVYYRPTAKLAAALRGGDSNASLLQSSSSSESDDDIFDRVEHYGMIYSVIERYNEGD